jgi:hypothetical protein
MGDDSRDSYGRWRRHHARQGVGGAIEINRSSGHVKWPHRLPKLFELPASDCGDSPVEEYCRFMALASILVRGNLNGRDDVQNCLGV